MIHDFLVDDSRPDKHISSSLDAVERILFTAAKHWYTRLSSVSSNKKWFDKECRLKIHNWGNFLIQKKKESSQDFAYRENRKQKRSETEGN